MPDVRSQIGLDCTPHTSLTLLPRPVRRTRVVLYFIDVERAPDKKNRIHPSDAKCRRMH